MASKINTPAIGSKNIDNTGTRLNIPDRSIIPFIEGDSIDIKECIANAFLQDTVLHP